ncbi:MAG: nitrate reductase, partial [Pseudomonadota bacterium]
MTTPPVRTACPYCGVGCGVLATPDGRGGAAIAGDPAHPANGGRLCSKGSALGETLDLEGRLLRPRIRGRDAHWDEAIDLVAERFRAAVAQHGPDSVACGGAGELRAGESCGA